MESNNFQYESGMKWENAGEGVVRQIMAYNDDLMMVKVKFETGAVGTPHTHPHTQATYVATGGTAWLQMPGSGCADRHIQSDTERFSLTYLK